MCPGLSPSRFGLLIFFQGVCRVPADRLKGSLAISHAGLDKTHCSELMCFGHVLGGSDKISPMNSPGENIGTLPCKAVAPMDPADEPGKVINNVRTMLTLLQADWQAKKQPSSPSCLQENMILVMHRR